MTVLENGEEVADAGGSPAERGEEGEDHSDLTVEESAGQPGPVGKRGEEVAPGDAAGGGLAAGRNGVVKRYDFYHREAMDRTRLRRFIPILETLTHRISASLTSSLGSPAHVAVKTQEQYRWDEYSASLPEATFLASVVLIPLGGRVLMHVPIDVAMLLVDFRLGGGGWGQFPVRPLTEIEQHIVGQLAGELFAEFVPSLSPVLNVHLGAVTQVSNVIFLQIAKPNEVCLIVECSLEIGEGLTGSFTLCLPLNVMLPILDALDRLEAAQVLGPESDIRQELEVLLYEIPIDTSVRFPSVPIDSDELLRIKVGDVIPLHQEPGRHLEMEAAGIPLCFVLPTSKGKRQACVVVDMEGE